MITGNRSKKSASELKSELTFDKVAPDAPAHLSGLALDEWNRIVPILSRMGLIAEQYMAPLTVYCQAWADYVNVVRKIDERERSGKDGYIDVNLSGYKQMSVLYQVAQRAAYQLKSFAAEFGMTPAAISKVTGASPQSDLFGYADSEKKADSYFS